MFFACLKASTTIIIRQMEMVWVRNSNAIVQRPGTCCIVAHCFRFSQITGFIYRSTLCSTDFHNLFVFFICLFSTSNPSIRCTHLFSKPSASVTILNWKPSKFHLKSNKSNHRHQRYQELHERHREPAKFKTGMPHCIAKSPKHPWASSLYVHLYIVSAPFMDAKFCN